MSDDARSPAPDTLQSFTQPDLAWEIRVATAGDEPWFVASDAEHPLGAEYLGPALDRLDETDRATVTLATGSTLVLVSEPALYALALGSGHRLANRFVRWISHDVVPAVRRDAGGAGRLGRRELAQMVIDAEDARERAEARAGELEAVSAELAVKAEAFDAFIEADGTYSMGAAANLLGIGRNNLFRRLREEKILQADNRPYQRYAHHFRVTAGSHEQKGREVGHYTTRVHASGVDFIRRRLQAPGLFAMAG
ncbi:MAG TPA: phage antirepressor KilAC domain-containing protein [Actinophytocola sp.]|uniref:phage antirepressor n=1 Tax=Actinophytocola sp. TaxID=1872138 RepID=UPI002DBCB4EA|nr:phage antirepressor KilAC domain-containing protein [Actinophytocola sp.]HEU5473609.1 phage antirepressor KilAC domain-containing protein [Actinophytocola sp.]